MSSLENCPFNSFAHLLIRIFWSYFVCFCDWVVGIHLMFYINPLSDIWFAGIFCPIGCLFTVLMISFAVQKLFTVDPYTTLV